MTVKKFRAICVAALLIFAGRLHAQPAPMMPAVPDQIPQDESQVAGEVQIVRWDMLLNQAGADAVNKTATPVPSASKIYQAMTCSGFEMRSAMADAITNNGVEQTSQNIAFAQMWNGQSLMIQQQLFFNYSSNNNRNAVRMNGFAQGMQDTFSRQPADHLKIKLNDAFSNLSLFENNTRPTQIKTKPSIQYEGDLAPGDAVAFMAPFTAASKTVYYQLTVWETFKAPSPMLQFMANERNAAWWCQNGPAKLRQWAAAASIWESQNAHPADDAPADFVKKLSDGKELKLIGICNPSTAPWCWWDAQGKPVTGVPNYGVYFGADIPQGLWAAVEVKGTSAEARLQTPTTQPVQDLNANMPPGQEYIQYGFEQIDAGTDRIKAGTPVGPWEEIAQMNAGEDKQIEGATFKIQNARSNGSGNFGIQFTMPGTTDKIFGLSAVRNDGKEAQSYNYFAPVEFIGKNPGSNGGNMNMGLQFQGFALADVQYYRLCQRKREFQTFTGFASQPLTPVKTEFTPDEISAAMKIKQDQADQQQQQAAKESLAQEQARRKDWDAIVPDLTAPMGMLKYLSNAALKGDEKTVRGLMQSSNPADAATIDTFAHFLTLSESNWQKANDLFGQANVLDLAQRNPQFRDFGLAFLQIPWTKSDDGTWQAQGNDMTLRKDSDGHYYMDLAGIISQPQAERGIKQITTLEEKIAACLNQPNVTTDQLNGALAALATPIQ